MSDYRHERGRDDHDELPPADVGVTMALREAVGLPPYEAVDWDAMRASIVGDAAGILAWRRQRGGWSSYVVRWSRAALPIGLAAGVAAAVTLAFAPLPGTLGDEAAPGVQTALTADVLFGVANGSVSRATIADNVTEPLLVALGADAVMTGGVQ